MSKVLFCANTSGHLPYWENILIALERLNYEVIITYTHSQRINNKEEYQENGFKVVRFPIRELSRLDNVARDTQTALNYRARKDQSVYYFERWAARLPHWLWRIVLNRHTGNLLMGLRAEKIIKLFIEKKPANRDVKAFIEEIGPEFVLASPANLQGSLDIECVKAARELNIPSAILALSWDNLTTKGLFHAVPDMLFVWNSVHKKEAEVVHGIPSENIEVSGSPFFEKWLRPEFLGGEKEGLMEKMGLKRDARYVLYVGSTKRIAEDEGWLVKDIDEMIHREFPDLYLVVRPHPANVEPFKNIVSERVIVWPKEGVLATKKQDVDDYRIMLTNALAVVGINTSAMVDAVVLGVPTVAFLVEKYRRTQVEAIHFKYMMESHAVGLVEHADELMNLLQAIDLNKAWGEEDRGNFVKKFIAPYGRDIMPSEYIAEKIDNCIAHDPA